MTFPSEEPEATPPSAEAVARRALILSALACRAHVDTSPDHPEARDVYARLADWLRDTGLLRSAEPEETQLLSSPQGSLDEKTRIQTSWSAEAVGPLSWALGLFQLPPHDRKLDPFEVTGAVAFLSPQVQEIISAARLRSPDEIAACREVYYAIHARLRDFRRHGGKKDFSGWIDQSWLHLLQLAPESLMTKGDLSIAGRAIWDCDQETLTTCESVVYERHKATIWLAGEQSPYTQITVDT